MKDSSRFWDRIANRYYQSPIKDVEAYEKKLNITRSFLNPDSNVLEFGCGTGGTAIAHAPYVKQIHAIDVSEKMLEYAQTQTDQKNINNVSFEKASIESFVAPDASFDVILGLSIMHLVDDRDAVLEKVFQYLKPGGDFVSSTACMGDSVTFFKYIFPIGRALGVIPIVKVFKEAQLVDEMSATGFSVVKQWRPKNNMAAFIVAQRTATSTEKLSNLSTAEQNTPSGTSAPFASNFS